MAEKLVAGGVW